MFQYFGKLTNYSQIRFQKDRNIQANNNNTMHSFIMKITHSLAAKDAIAVARGVYKVVEGGIYASSNNNPNSKQEKSWHNKLQILTPQYKQSTVKQGNIKNQTVNIKANQKLKNQQMKTKPNTSQRQNHKQISLENKAQSLQQANKILFVKQNQQNKQKLTSYKDLLKDVQQRQKTKTHLQKTIQTVQSKVPSSRISRIYQFTKLGLNIAQSAVQAYFTKLDDSKNSNDTYQRLANKISNQLCKMRGAPLKLAQMLSIQQDKLIPKPIRKAFQKARQTAHVLPLDEVIFMMEKNFGKQWRSKFTNFEQKPFASASIGQVHRGKLSNNQNIAIKIQYPGVRKSIQSDISNLYLLMKIPGVFPKGMFMDRILKNTKQQLSEQCDYYLQKQKQQAYQKCLKQCLKDESNLYKVPKIYSELTTQQIFTSQYLQGVSMKNIEQSNYPQEIKDQIGRRIMEITFNQLFQMGIVQSDPNPANFTYNFSKDQLNLFDFGATHVYKRKFLEDYFKIISGSVSQNKQLIWQASIDTGFVTGQQSEVMKQNHIQSILIIGQPLRYKGKYDFGNQNITQKIYKTIPVMFKNRLKHPPEEVYSLHRKLSGTYLACMRLKSRIDCSKIWQQIKFQRIIEKVQKSQKSKLIV